MNAIMSREAVEKLIYFYYGSYAGSNKKVKITKCFNLDQNDNQSFAPFGALIEKEVIYENASYTITANLDINDILKIVKEYFESIGFEVGSIEYEIFQDKYSNWKDEIVFYVKAENNIRRKGI